MQFLKIKKKAKPTPEMLELLRAAADPDFFVAREAQMLLTKALSLPLDEAVLPGDIIGTIFPEEDLQPGQSPEYPKSFLTPDNEGDYVAFVTPGYGGIPYRQVAGDYVMVPTYPISNAIDCTLRYVRDARWGVVQKMQEVLLWGHTKKKNDDGFHTMLAAAAARNVVVNDSSAASGLFTKRLIALLMTKMMRLGGGNTMSMRRRRLTDVWCSLECAQDMRTWDLTQVDDVTRREIFIASDEDQALNTIFGVRIHPLTELGVGQPYQTYLSDTLGASLGSKEEFLLGVDLSNDDSFIMPRRQTLQTFPDVLIHREGKLGFYSSEEVGFACLDSRSVILAAA